MTVMIEWLNFITLNISAIMSFMFYTFSVTPSLQEKKLGERAWKMNSMFRLISDILFLILIINIFLWIWFPINELNLKFMKNELIPVIVASALAIPFLYIIIKSILDAGRETIKPSKETELYSGIYFYVRHPQMAATIPLFAIICFGMNSVFLLLWMIGLMIIVVPIVIYFEEKDLLNRFGEQYLQYKRTTGAIFPKLKK